MTNIHTVRPTYVAYLIIIVYAVTRGFAHLKREVNSRYVKLKSRQLLKDVSVNNEENNEP